MQTCQLSPHFPDITSQDGGSRGRAGLGVQSMRLVLLGEALAYLMELNIWAGDGDLWVSRLFHLQEIRIVVGINATIFQACTGIISPSVAILQG